MKQIKEVLKGIYSNKELRKTVVPLFMGDPGLGKTFLINEFVDFAKQNKANFVDFFGTTDYDPNITELITSQISPFEVSGIAIPDKDLKQMVYYNLNKLSSLKDGDILFFDELPNGNPVVLSACLTLLEGRRMMSGDPLPDIMIIAAGNYQGMSPMTPQIKRRFVWYNVKFDAEMWKEFMADKYKMPKTVSSKLCNLIKNEDFTGYNFSTSADFDKAVNMIINGVPTPYDYIIKDILNTPITNPLEEAIEFENGERFEPSETLPWLEIARKSSTIVIPEVEAKVEDEGIGDYDDIPF